MKYVIDRAYREPITEETLARARQHFTKLLEEIAEREDREYNKIIKLYRMQRDENSKN